MGMGNAQNHANKDEQLLHVLVLPPGRPGTLRPDKKSRFSARNPGETAGKGTLHDSSFRFPTLA
jgi:hypothetical protein